MRATTIKRLHARRWAILLATLSALVPLTASAKADFGVQPNGFESSLLDEAGTVLDPAQAGARPAAQSITFNLNTVYHDFPDSPGGYYPGTIGDKADPDGQIKTAVTELPPGLLGDPQAVPRCELADFPPATQFGTSRCQTSAQVGVASVSFGLSSGTQNPLESSVTKAPVYNLVPPNGVLARIGFVTGVPVVIDITLRTDGDYGLNATASNIAQILNIFATRVRLWGVPADPSHDTQRYLPGASSPGNQAPYGGGGPLPSDQPRTPFMTNPTRCGVGLTSGLAVSSWEDPGNFLHYTSEPTTFTGCDQLDFDPSIEAKPTTTLADAPSGLDFNLHIPQHNTLAQNEVQSLSVLATEGQFKLGFGGETTSDLGFNSSPSEVQSALETLPAIGAGNVGVSGGPGNATGSTPYAIVFKGALAHTDVEELSVEDGTTPLQITSGAGTFPGQASVATTIGGTAEGSVGAESSTAHLRDAVVTLPEGMTVNPPSADVLSACSLAQVGMSASGVANSNPVTCPDASILGKATVNTPPIGHPLPGIVYLAKQNENPFNSLLAIYLVIDDPDSGIRIKLPGKIDPDPVTGQLTVSFRENPQTPVEDIEMSFFGGPHASLKTPATCGAHTVTSQMTPWTAPEGETKTPTSAFALTAGPDGGACSAAGAGAPNKFSFLAGTAERTAKAFSPFSFKLSRADGTQQLSRIDATLPKGLIGKLAGIPYCSDADLATAAGKSGKAEQASPSCPAASRVGSVDVGAGAGPTPIYVSGNAYLAGPYKGAPLSLAVITPAVAGPFDLGTVVVRNALNVDPESAQVHAVSDPLPTILQGIPLNLRSVAVKLDRSQFTLNPTNCDPLSIDGTATSVFNQPTALTSRFQADECARLGFKPKLALSLKGATKRSGHPALKAVLRMPKADANIARTVVSLPHSEFLAQNHIRTVCTRVQFAAGAGNGAECPKGSIYGKASATTPLLDQPISGPVYLRSSSNPLPDLVAALHGQIDVDLVGRIDSKNGGIRTTFASVPDAPVTRFVLEMQGGKKGLLENSRNLCKSTNRANAVFDAHNAKSAELRPELENSCPKARKGGGKKHKKGAKHRR